MSFNVSRESAARMTSLLDTAMCSRAALVEHLASLTYIPSPDLAPPVLDPTGFIVCPARSVELADLKVSLATRSRLRKIARHTKLSPARSSGDISSITIDAILSQLIVPTDPTAPLHPPFSLYHQSKSTPLFLISEKARDELERLALEMPNNPSTRKGSAHHRLVRRRHFAPIVSAITQYELSWSNSTTHLHLVPHPKRRVLSAVRPHHIEYLAAEGIRLGLPRARGGRRTALAMASQVLEALGQRILILSSYRVGTWTRDSDNNEKGDHRT